MEHKFPYISGISFVSAAIYFTRGDDEKLEFLFYVHVTVHRDM